MQSGALSIRVLKGTSKWKLLKDWMQMSLGHTLGRPDLDLFRITEATVETAPLQDVSVDGEIVSRTPLHIRLAPRALRVMRPRVSSSG